jgi:hypothetical protein
VLFSKIIAKSQYNLWDKILFWYENSAIKAWLEGLENNVSSIQSGDYENLTMTASTLATVRNVLLGLVIGAILASAAACYTKAVHGKFVRELLKRECFTPETAITLRECGFFCNPSVRRDLFRGGALAKITRCTEQIEGDTTPDLLTARFYIPEEDKYRAEFRYTNKGATVSHLILTAVVCIVCAILLLKGLPMLLGFADWILGAFH